MQSYAVFLFAERNFRLCVNRNFDTIFDPVLPEPNRIFGLLNLSNTNNNKMGWLRCRFGFAFTRSAVMCLRGSRSRAGQPRCAVEPALASAEERLPNQH